MSKERHHRAMTPSWSPDRYARHAGFVPALAVPLLERLRLGPGLRVLDIGCGDGALTSMMAARGATVVGIDASPEMVAAAVARGLDARVMDARALDFTACFDVVFSNAALHWVPEADAALAGIARALVPGGRFVAEFGGHTNIAAITVACRAVLTRRGHRVQWPWYFPTCSDYAALCRARGLRVESLALIPRPTPLPTGISGWLETFAGPLTSGLPPGERAFVLAEIEALLAPSLRDADGRWTADYVRLQVEARRSEKF